MHKYLLLIMLLVSAWSVAAETPEHKEKAHWSKMARAAESQIEDIKFVGRVIDQDGKPVVDAEVFMEGGSNFLASGSGQFTVRTDENGYFSVLNKKGLYLRIGGIKKAGYEINVIISGQGNPHLYGYKESRNALVWTDYTHEHPYVIKAWRVDHYAKVKHEKDRGLGFVPDGSVETIDFNGTDRVKWKEIRQGDLRVSAKRNEKEWSVRVEAVDGWLSETEQFYKNVAPENGSYKQLIFNGKSNGDEFNSRGIVVNKSFYFMSQGGKRYGVVSMRIRPYFNEDTVIYTSYVINLEGGRELAVKQKE